MKMTPVIQKMVLHWGEMSARWGINRTVAQIHALLFFSSKPLPADDIVEALGVARSHVSNSLRELQSWGVVSVVHELGDRRDHFQSIKDVWQLFEALLDERKRREVDPTLKMLREAAAQSDGQSQDDVESKARIKEMLEFFETMDAWYDQMRRMPLPMRVKLVKLGGKVGQWLQ
jgi:DNA-binding transcriptional regulator GbsR (MarR family)